MNETLRRARERQQVLSALMPFRASFYEHFGYGIVEHRCDWTVPASILPSVDCSGFSTHRPEDLPAIQDLRQQCIQLGQCELERPADQWNHYIEAWNNGFVLVDRGSDGRICGWLSVEDARDGTRVGLRVLDHYWMGAAGLKRQLALLGSMKDQYGFITISLPTDLDLNLLLRESQIPHRAVNHPTADVRMYTRMQIRVLDHRRFLESIRWPEHARGSAVICVNEVEGDCSKFRIDVEAGRASVKPSNDTADATMPDRAWAAIACGDLDPAHAKWLGAMDANERAIALLAHLRAGPVPFCRDYF